MEAEFVVNVEYKYTLENQTLCAAQRALLNITKIMGSQSLVIVFAQWEFFCFLLLLQKYAYKRMVICPLGNSPPAGFLHHYLFNAAVVDADRWHMT